MLMLLAYCDVSTGVIRRGHNADALARVVFWRLLSEASARSSAMFPVPQMSCQIRVCKRLTSNNLTKYDNIMPTFLNQGTQCHGTNFIYNDLGRDPDPKTSHRFDDFRTLCGKTFLDTPDCYKPFKFAIAMENKGERGYISEKIFSALLGDTVPVYFGSPDVTDFINPERIVLCTVPYAKLRLLRARKKGKIRKSAYSLHPLGSENHTFSLKPARSWDLVEWATQALRAELAPCVAKALSLHRDDEAYLRALTAHPIAAAARGATTATGREDLFGARRPAREALRAFFQERWPPGAVW